MPHQCVKCGEFYDDDAEEILKGCENCGGKVFFYVRKGKEELLKEQRQVELSDAQREQIEHDVYDLIGNEIDRDRPVVLDLEAIKVGKPGQYEIDLVSILDEKQPLVYKLEDGKYVVDLIESFRKMRGEK
ncbi:hypothetical protein D6789_00915 [Candidatus Woesearchaeota archaeon]|nr:MAG: hypothetical protein D6789_00915 [Candidatus Woesearchaeota archaeon]